MNPNARLKLLLRSAAELAGVTLLVFATGWVGVRAAEMAHQFPVRAGRGGVIEMRLAKSDRHGDVTFIEAGYSGWFNCRGADWAIDWRFATEPKQPYQVEVLVAAPEKILAETIEVTIRGSGSESTQVLRADIANAAPGKWKTISFGEVALGDGSFVLTVRPGSGGLTNLNIKLAALRPRQTAS